LLLGGDQVVTSGNPIIFSGNANEPLAREVARLLGVPFAGNPCSQFPDRETKVDFKKLELPKLHGSDAYIIQPTQAPDRNLMELQLMISGLRDSAHRITGVVPFNGYARQDRKSAPLEPISIVDVARNLANTGVDDLVFMDLHVQQIIGVYKAIRPRLHVDHLYARPVILDWFSKQDMSNAIISSIDSGGAKWVESYWERASTNGNDVNFGIGYKKRKSPSDPGVIKLFGDFTGRQTYFTDDMVSTGGSADAATETALDEMGAAEVDVVAIHPVIATLQVAERIAKSRIRRFITTDSIPISDEARVILGDKLVIVSIAPLLASAIRRLHDNDGVGEGDGGLFELEAYRKDIITLPGIDRRRPRGVASPTTALVQ